MDDRHHDFRTGCGIAGDMARKGPNIRNALRHALLSCCAADTFAKGNANAGRLALKRTKHQFIAHQPIEARPVENGQKLPDQSGRSEERRVGKEYVSSVDIGGRRIITKQKQTEVRKRYQYKRRKKIM